MDNSLGSINFPVSLLKLYVTTEITDKKCSLYQYRYTFFMDIPVQTKLKTHCM